jgi:hypothetical protein
MRNIDCEVYIRQLITFFEKNPNDLIDLIGDLQKDEFYDLLRGQCDENSKNGDHIITRDQMINIVLKLKLPEIVKDEESKEVVASYVMKTKWGEIILN